MIEKEIYVDFSIPSNQYLKLTKLDVGYRIKVWFFENGEQRKIKDNENIILVIKHNQYKDLIINQCIRRDDGSIDFLIINDLTKYDGQGEMQFVLQKDGVVLNSAINKVIFGKTLYNDELDDCMCGDTINYLISKIEELQLDLDKQKRDPKYYLVDENKDYLLDENENYLVDGGIINE